MKMANIRNKLILIFELLLSVFSLDDIKSCLADQKGGLVLPIGGEHIEDEDWIRYKLLKVDKSLKSINLSDLPSDFCEEACKLVDEFRRKTVNEKIEWLLYIDYKTGEIVYCWKGEEGRCSSDIDSKYFIGKNIATIHNHTKKYYSFPSPDNFDILENDFEDYEIITSINAFWTVEFKGSIARKLRENFQLNLSIEFEKMEFEIKSHYVDVLRVRHMSEMLFSEYLLDDIEKSIENIPLVLNKKEYD